MTSASRQLLRALLPESQQSATSQLPTARGRSSLLQRPASPRPEPAFDPSVAVQAAGRVHRLGQTKEVKIVQLAYRGTLDVPILAVHDQIRDGVLKLQNGLLPPEVQAMFDAYRAKHKDQSCNNTAEISAKMRQLANLRKSVDWRMLIQTRV